MVQILFIAAISSILVGIYDNPSEGWASGLLVLIVVIIIVGVSTINEIIKELQFRKLSS